jgi:hypothetical protein
MGRLARKASKFGYFRVAQKTTVSSRDPAPRGSASWAIKAIAVGDISYINGIVRPTLHAFPMHALRYSLLARRCSRNAAQLDGQLQYLIRQTQVTRRDLVDTPVIKLHDHLFSLKTLHGTVARPAASSEMNSVPLLETGSPLGVELRRSPLHVTHYGP